MKEERMPPDFEPLAEGGCCRRIYTGPIEGKRPAATAIEYLLPAGGRSALHCLDADELWIHRQGGTLVTWMIDGEGVRRQKLAQGQWCLFPRGCIFGAQGDPLQDTRVICVVCPGYETAGFTLCTLRQLREVLPGEWERLAFLLGRGQEIGPEVKKDVDNFRML